MAPDDELVTVWSAALERAGEAPGLSQMTGPTQIGAIIRGVEAARERRHAASRVRPRSEWPAPPADIGLEVVAREEAAAEVAPEADAPEPEEAPASVDVDVAELPAVEVAEPAEDVRPADEGEGPASDAG